MDINLLGLVMICIVPGLCKDSISNGTCIGPQIEVGSRCSLSGNCSFKVLNYGHLDTACTYNGVNGDCSSKGFRDGHTSCKDCYLNITVGYYTVDDLITDKCDENRCTLCKQPVHVNCTAIIKQVASIQHGNNIEYSKLVEEVKKSCYNITDTACSSKRCQVFRIYTIPGVVTSTSTTRSSTTVDNTTKPTHTETVVSVQPVHNKRVDGDVSSGVKISSLNFISLFIALFIWAS